MLSCRIKIHVHFTDRLSAWFLPNVVCQWVWYLNESGIPSPPAGTWQAILSFHILSDRVTSIVRTNTHWFRRDTLGSRRRSCMSSTWGPVLPIPVPRQYHWYVLEPDTPSLPMNSKLSSRLVLFEKVAIPQDGTLSQPMTMRRPPLSTSRPCPLGLVAYSYHLMTLSATYLFSNWVLYRSWVDEPSGIVKIAPSPPEALNKRSLIENQFLLASL